MSENFPTLAGVCVALAVIQFLAALPWLGALDPRLRERYRQPSFWGVGLLVAAGVGLAVAFLFDASSDPDVLGRWGRVYASALHLQLAADLIVGIFAVVLRFWPKGGAVAAATCRESMRQPMYWLIFAIAGLAMVAAPFLEYFTFGEDLKMVQELCYAFAMLGPVFFGVLAAALSVSEEIEGRTAITLMSKPVSRRQFLLGKFGGILLAALAMTALLGWIMIWMVLFERYDQPLYNRAALTDPEWVATRPTEWLGAGPAADLVRGGLRWAHDAGMMLPGLVIGFCQVMVLIAVAVALATRVPMIVNLSACLLVYFLGHLTPIMTEVSRNYALVHFVAQVFDTVLPGLDLFDVGTAIVREVPLPQAEYALYTLNVSLYAVVYTSIALLFGLILFEDRDLA